MAGISGPAALVATVYNICVNFKMKLFKRNNVVYRQDNVNTLFFQTLVIVLVTCKDTLEFDYDESHSGAGMKYQTQVIIQINSKDRYVTYFFIRF